MAKAAVCVHQCFAQPDGIVVAFTCEFDNGSAYSGGAKVGWTTSGAQVILGIRNQIIADAPGFGVSGLGLTDVVVFGGPS